MSQAVGIVAIDALPKGTTQNTMLLTPKCQLYLALIMVAQEQINLSTKGHAYPHDLTP